MEKKVVFVQAVYNDNNNAKEVAGDKFASDINLKIEALEHKGFEVIDIITVFSGSGVAVQSGSAAYGYAYTQGVLILAEKK